MKRIWGALVIVVGLSGCISFTTPNSESKSKSSDAQPAVAKKSASPAPANGAAPVSPGSPWVMHPDHARPKTEYTAARPANPPAPLPKNLPMSASLVPVVNTPRPGQPAPEQRPAPTAVAQANAPMPRIETVDTSSRKPAIQTVGYVNKIETPREPSVVPQPEIRTATRPVPLPPTPTVKGSMPAEARHAKSGAPLVRMVNTRRITLNFEVKDVGPSGLSSVELWYTQDCRDWKKYDAPTQAQAYVVEVDEEGMYGFTLLARSGLGLGQEPPAPGDQPQVWVFVDLTKPDVQLTEVVPSSQQSQQVTIRWKAMDKNLGRSPISLYYAETEKGPWKPIAANLANNGKYVWQVPQNTPPRIVLKVEATDLAGNTGSAQTSKPVLMDSSRPSVSIINVEANSR